MKAGVLYSGGKDSTMALYEALKSKTEEVKYLISVFPENPESYMFHVPNIELTKLSSKAVGIPLIQVKTKGEKEKEVKDLEKALKKLDIDVLYFGGLESNYQRSRVYKVCKRLGIKAKAPFWQVDPLDYMEKIIKRNFKVIITSVSAEGFDKSWLGKELNYKTLEDILELNKKYGIHIAFEGGEAETLVLDCPIFKKKIKIVKAKKEWFNYHGILRIEEAKLVKKS
ncbi:ATP binding protein [Methanothermus fervidus DSM 2088]|uniref:ATP binding protein n=1 Tax=Methanothermus fervidus (strain ATCC 43054 / DSM 2088 / JCM 10308 / V24 S) TaxID=523846 RepID=E3GYS6_METFV|nr:TIGR00289 family protein [Methanothermus fervidus]ADP77458.1 ATP binding protein [Methanothermus fervidus DSM 2088]